MNRAKTRRKTRPIIFMLSMCCAISSMTVIAASKTMQIDGKPVPLTQDGIHDTQNEAISVLQNPEAAMKDFPRDDKGIVDWVKTINDGHILPRAEKLGQGKMSTKDLDIILKNTGSMAPVKFPHQQHTLWLACNNCHDNLFKPKAGANKISMQEILKGQSCGVCHGKVAFPPTKNCTRCHSEKK